MKVTYNAPPGDSKVCEMGGVTFFDGVAVDVDESSHLGGKLKTNQHFTIKAPRAKAEKVEAPVEDDIGDRDEPHADADMDDEPAAPTRRRRGGK
jgi:hypothetical protein